MGTGNPSQPKDGGSKGTDGRAGNRTQPKDGGSKGTIRKAGNGKADDGKERGAKPVTGKGDNSKKGDDKGGPGRKKRTRPQGDDYDDDEDIGDDDFLNPPHLRSPKRKRGNVAAAVSGQPPRQSKRQRRTPVRP